MSDNNYVALKHNAPTKKDLLLIVVSSKVESFINKDQQEKYILYLTGVTPAGVRKNITIFRNDFIKFNTLKSKYVIMFHYEERVAGVTTHSDKDGTPIYHKETATHYLPYWERVDMVIDDITMLNILSKSE